MIDDQHINQLLDPSTLPEILQRIHMEVTASYGIGKVADYIPDLKKVQPRQFAMALRTVSGEEFIASLSGNTNNRIDQRVAAGEKATGFQNMAIGYLLKALGNLHSDVEQTMDCYFKQCAMSMSCLDLVRATECLVNRGPSNFNPHFNGQGMAKRINSLMLMCGLYDAVGNFAYNVGLPAKSGVGGGIVAVCPAQYTVAVWSPELDHYGNSVLGQLALEKLSTYTHTSIF